MPMEPARAAPAPAHLPNRRSRCLLRRFGRDRRGATAVEFALVSIPFFALLFAIIELALAFWSTQVLETAVSEASRRLYTGQFQQHPDNVGRPNAELAQKFKKEVCGHVVGLFDCETLVHVDVQAAPPGGFPANFGTSPNKGGVFDPSAFGYQPSSPSQIVLVRAAMEYPVYVNLLGSGKTSLTNGKRLIMGTVAFRNEPYTQ